MTASGSTLIRMTDAEALEAAMTRLETHLVTRAIPERLRGHVDFAPELAGRLCQVVRERNGHDDGRWHTAIDHFIDYSLDFIELHAELQRTGRYHYDNFEALANDVYRNAEAMQGSYLDGLFLSQAFWINHHRTLRFFADAFCANAPEQGTILEVPVGTGAYLGEFVAHRPEWDAVGVDLSDSAVSYARTTIDLLAPGNSANTRCDNVLDLSDDTKFDRVVSGQLIENFEDPRPLLHKLRELLAPEGRLFLTSSVWVAAVDHIYVFESVDELREMVGEYFAIEQERPFPVFEHQDPSHHRVPVNYVAILRHR